MEGERQKQRETREKEVNTMLLYSICLCLMSLLMFECYHFLLAIESQSLIEALKSKASDRAVNKEAWPCGWSISCPALCDGNRSGKNEATANAI